MQTSDLKQLEKTINKELHTLGLLPISIECINTLSNEPVLTWTTPYNDNVDEYMDEINKTWDVVSRNYENWRKRTVQSSS